MWADEDRCTRCGRLTEGGPSAFCQSCTKIVDDVIREVNHR